MRPRAIWIDREAPDALVRRIAPCSRHACIPAKIRAAGRYNLNQAVLALVFNTSLSTVRQWEIGEKHSSGPSLKLLFLLDRNGLEVST